jgi:hypothetical protein
MDLHISQTRKPAGKSLVQRSQRYIQLLHLDLIFSGLSSLDYRIDIQFVAHYQAWSNDPGRTDCDVMDATAPEVSEHSRIR